MSRTLERLREGQIPRNFDWNDQNYSSVPLVVSHPSEPTPEKALKVKFVAEDLRDGLHGVPRYPSLEEMVDYVAALDELKIDIMTVGIYSGLGNKVDRTIKGLLDVMKKDFPQVTPIVLTLTTQDSLNWTKDCKEINPRLNAIVFMGTAPHRLLVEEWEKDFIINRLAWATNQMVKEEVEVIGATEHTTQTPPDFLREIVKVQVDNGAKYFCIADTIGIARPKGAYRITSYVRRILDGMGANDVLIDWHGHRDMGNDVSNAMAALAAGADRVHTVARGIGERAGNAQMEAVMLNLRRILDTYGLESPWRTEKLEDVLKAYNRMTNVPVTSHGPLSERSHTTSLGIHAAAMLKAKRLESEAKELGGEENGKLADELNALYQTIYTSVPPGWVGKEHEIRIGPSSGKGNVELAAILAGIDPKSISSKTIELILTYAAEAGRELEPEEFMRLLNDRH